LPTYVRTNLGTLPQHVWLTAIGKSTADFYGGTGEDGKPDWEGALRVMDAASDTFAQDSLEVSMTRHWAAACGLLSC
jgi:hypothetical protein